MAQAVGDNTGRLEAMVRERTEQLERLAQYDPLTSILNRRGFDHAFAREQNRARREGKPCGLMIVDLDRFKRVNDEYGHRGGDEVLVACVQRTSSVLRNYDACARWGGDEFILLISGCDAAALSAIAAKLGANLRDAPVPLADGRTVAVTASIGAVLVGEDESLSDATARADAALYEAKRNGRDGFVLHKSPLRAA